MYSIINKYSNISKINFVDLKFFDETALSKILNQCMKIQNSLNTAHYLINGCNDHSKINYQICRLVNIFSQIKQKK